MGGVVEVRPVERIEIASRMLGHVSSTSTFATTSAPESADEYDADEEQMSSEGEPMAEGGGAPVVTGLSPTEGIPGTQITIRGENLGTDPNDLLMLFICGTDCLHTAKWKSPSKIVARVGQASRGLGDVKIATKSGGRGVSNVQFRVFIAQVGQLEESAVWVDETRTVPGREAVRNVVQSTDERDALGLRVTGARGDQTWQRLLPDASSNVRMESFHPHAYILEHHKHTTIEDLREGIKNMDLDKANEAKKSEQMHKANLYSLINCVDTLANLYEELERGSKAGEFDVITKIAGLIGEARSSAESVFREVLSRKDRADATRNALSVLTRFRAIFFLSSSIDQNMAKGEYSTILNDYTRAKSLFKDTEVALFREVMAGVDAKMEMFKEELKHRLIDTPASFEEQSRLIKYLKILEPASDPAWDCITSYHCWLEDVLWKIQEEHYQRALDESQGASSASALIMPSDKPNSSARHSFVSELAKEVLTKLQSFWKLAGSYTSPNQSEQASRHDDINQMLTNSLNVCSWLLLNVCMPSAMPVDVARRYEQHLVRWPAVSDATNRSLLFHALKTLRWLLSSLYECQFTAAHVQPLAELCMTVRLKAISLVVDHAHDKIGRLGEAENWKQEYVDGRTSKTALPDHYENEVCECISSAQTALSTGGYPGEADLFARESFRNTLFKLFDHLIFSISYCVDRLLNLKTRREKKEEGGGGRPGELEIRQDGERENDRPQVTTKKLLIAICNVEYIMNVSLKNISRRLADCGVKYADVIYEKSRGKLLSYRQGLVNYYLLIKCSSIKELLSEATFDYLPEDDVSDYAKEIVMCVVLTQSELELCAPRLTAECLKQVVQSSFECVVERVMACPPRDHAATSQCVIDLSALEQSLAAYLSLETRTLLNSYRAELVGGLDQEKLRRCMLNMRSTMRLGLESLDAAGEEDDLDTSNI